MFLGFGNEAKAAAIDYYVSPTGSGTTCSSASPCTLATGLGKSLVGDDYLILKDGTYTGTSLTVPWSGTMGHSITIRAENDGQAIIDGQNNRRPCYIYQKSYITVEGIVFKNSNYDVIYLEGASYINIKKVSGYNTPDNANNHIFSVWGGNHILIEDCMASGTARTMITFMETNYVTVRRFWGKWTQYNSGWNAALQVYGSDNSIVENCIFLTSSSLDVHGINVGKASYNNSADNNKIYGNIVYGFNGYGIATSAYGGSTGLIDNVFKNNVTINTRYGFGARTNADVQNLTTIDASKGTDSFAYAVSKSDSSLPLVATLKNSLISTSPLGLSSDGSTFNHSYNDIYNVTTRYSGTNEATGEIFINPAYDTATYGKGSYLIIPAALVGQGEAGADIGATVKYRYVDGVITGDVLWPWPMENRIKAETGYSVTWEANGGLWKTLDGVYSQGDILPPTPPTGLAVN